MSETALDPVRKELLAGQSQAAAKFFEITFSINTFLGQTFPQFADKTKQAESVLQMCLSEKMINFPISKFLEKGFLNYEEHVQKKNVELLAMLLSEQLGQSPQALVQLVAQTDPKKIETIWNGIGHLFMNAKVYMINGNVLEATRNNNNDIMKAAQQIADETIRQSGGNRELAQQMIMQDYMQKIQQAMKQ